MITHWELFWCIVGVLLIAIGCVIAFAARKTKAAIVRVLCAAGSALIDFLSAVWAVIGPRAQSRTIVGAFLVQLGIFFGLPAEAFDFEAWTTRLWVFANVVGFALTWLGREKAAGPIASAQSARLLAKRAVSEHFGNPNRADVGALRFRQADPASLGAAAVAVERVF